MSIRFFIISSLAGLLMAGVMFVWAASRAAKLDAGHAPSHLLDAPQPDSLPKTTPSIIATLGTADGSHG